MATLTDQTLTPSPLPEEKVTHHGLVSLAVTPLLTLLSTVCVILRMLSRRMASSFQIDDWTVLAALVCAYGAMITAMLSVTVGHGSYDLEQHNKSQLKTWMKLALISNFFFNLSNTLTKISVLLFYRRLFQLHRILLILIHVLMFLVLCYFVVATTGVFISLESPGTQWKSMIPHRNVMKDPKTLAYISGILNSILDALILAIPQYIVWKLQWSRKKRLLVSGVFIIGAITCILSIARVIYLAIGTSKDMDYTTVVSQVLTEAELNAGIICCCLPMFPSLIRRWKEKYTPKNSDDPSSSGTFPLTFGRGRVRRFPTATGREDSTEALNTEVDPAYQGAS